MIQFFETVMGKRFYEGQLPQLIKALERIATLLEKLHEFYTVDPWVRDAQQRRDWESRVMGIDAAFPEDDPKAGLDARFQHARHVYRGYRSYVVSQGKASNPYSPGSARANSWQMGFEDAQRELG